MNETDTPFASFCVVELMGRIMFGAYVTEVTLAGAGLLRCDIPAVDDDPAITQYIAPSSLYRLTPCSEQIARAVAKHQRPEPISRWYLEPQKPAAVIREARPPLSDDEYNDLKEQEDIDAEAGYGHHHDSLSEEGCDECTAMLDGISEHFIPGDAELQNEPCALAFDGRELPFS